MGSFFLLDLELEVNVQLWLHLYCTEAQTNATGSDLSGFQTGQVSGRAWSRRCCCWEKLLSHASPHPHTRQKIGGSQKQVGEGLRYISS